MNRKRAGLTYDISAQSEAIEVPPVTDVRRVRNVMIPVRDGVHLAADLFIPADFDPRTTTLPVVVEYTPYRKDHADLTARRFYLYMPRHGYIFARVDVRGTGGSEGVSRDEYVLQEQEDGYDAVEWLARQTWCDGNVSMMGISYGGFTALQVAAHNPPHLASIIAVDFTDDRYQDECHYKGGLMRLYYNLAYYGGFMIALNALPPLPEASAGRWSEIWEQHLTENEPYLLNWYRNQVDGPYWWHGSVGHTPDQIRCPVFMIGGWRDGYINAPLRLYEKLNVPRRVLIGPWNHAMPDAAIPGPRIDYLPEVVRWLDHWCKGRSTKIMEDPPVIVYLQEYESPIVDRLEAKGFWRCEKEWPPPGRKESILFLDRRKNLRADIGDNGVDDLFYNPTVGLHGGLFSGGIPFGLPGDQRPDEALSLTYTTQPLEKDLCILGRPRARLFVESTAAVIGFVASLSDVAADGSSHLVCKGALNATRRDSLTNPAPLPPGKIVGLDIGLDCTGWIFRRGQRIRLSISNADWPNLWPTPELARTRVHLGRNFPSRLILQVVPVRAAELPAAFVASPMKVRRHSDAPRPPTWDVYRDMLTGRTSVNIRLGSDVRLTPHTSVERDSSSTFEVDPADPAHATGQGVHRIAMRSGNQLIEARSTLFVQATTGHFHTTIHLAVEVNGSLHASRKWVESIERQML